jgi:hypothetical protein
MLEWIFLIVGVALLALFNYYMNLAPGSDPEDFIIGPKEVGIQCDCMINSLILAGIAVVAISASAAAFDSRLELYLAGGIAFFVITAAGLMGRKRRHHEWKELRKVIHRAVPGVHPLSGRRSPVDIVFEDPDEYEDE